jgi:hypothetical protein
VFGLSARAHVTLIRSSDQISILALNRASTFRKKRDNPFDPPMLQANLERMMLTDSRRRPVRKLERFTLRDGRRFVAHSYCS